MIMFRENFVEKVSYVDMIKKISVGYKCYHKGSDDPLCKNITRALRARRPEFDRDGYLYLA